MKVLSLLLVVVVVASAKRRQHKDCIGFAQYEVSFQGDLKTGKNDPDVHFTPFVGITHSATRVTEWDSGMAPAALQELATTGKTAGLEKLIKDGKIAGAGRRPIGPSGKTVDSKGKDATSHVDVFEVNAAHPAAHVVSMIAPSPDWYTYAHANLCNHKNGKWYESVKTMAMGLDAGVREGTSYVVGGTGKTTPKAAIAPLGGKQMKKVGKYTFHRIDGASAEKKCKNVLRKDCKRANKRSRDRKTCYNTKVTKCTTPKVSLKVQCMAKAEKDCKAKGGSKAKVKKCTDKAQKEC